ncbi:proteasome assembly chaperone family protein [Halorussus sp. MSC15.2]|uniref:proteasome assembly chaperone family protein n=1 Tax=Halorussus sp. MSC15.2 TaxID=2283638 RepID=UPI0013D73595|nr:PAC2 family protein [Halorussus sp. MSC15.2]NEU55886.1 proteasome assembly chaperone family protein [Halorussus sp. MSC15.2]
MAHVTVEKPGLSLDAPTLVDGLPGEGLIGKLVTDRLVSEFEMEYYAGAYCEGVPPVAAYRAGDSEVRPGIQLYADVDRDLLVLVSDIPVSTSSAPAFAGCLTDWLRDNDVTPIYISGLSNAGTDDEDGSRALYGLSIGDGDRLLDEADVAEPEHAGMVTGPTGALLNRTSDEDMDGVGLLVETDGSLPDYDAAQVVLERGIEPIVGIDVDTEAFSADAHELSAVAQSALQQLGGDGDGNSRAQPTPTFY